MIRAESSQRYIMRLMRLLSNTEINDLYHYLTAQEVKRPEREAERF